MKQSSKVKSTQCVRIIGGTYRGKKIHFPAIEGLRPTTDRIRETLFNWLMHDIRNARCLDAFAGSGALGLEAFSRGAAEVVFIEHAKEAYTNLKKIVESFNSPKMSVISNDAIKYIQQANTQFDIIFIDPPFANLHLFDCVSHLATSPLLIEGGLLYLESPNELLLDPAHWEKIKYKQTGQVCYALYRKIP